MFLEGTMDSIVIIIDHWLCMGSLVNENILLATVLLGSGVGWADCCVASSIFPCLLTLNTLSCFLP